MRWGHFGARRGDDSIRCRTSASAEFGRYEGESSTSPLRHLRLCCQPIQRAQYDGRFQICVSHLYCPSKRRLGVSSGLGLSNHYSIQGHIDSVSASMEHDCDTMFIVVLGLHESLRFVEKQDRPQDCTGFTRHLIRQLEPTIAPSCSYSCPMSTLEAVKNVHQSHIYKTVSLRSLMWPPSPSQTQRHA